MNNTNLEQNYVHVRSILKIQTQGKKDCFRKTVLRIIRDARKNKNFTLAIFSLIVIFPYLRSDERKMEVYQILAQKISQCVPDMHLDLIEYLILNTNNSILRAMCWVWEYTWCIGVHDPDGIEMQKSILHDFGIDFYFDHQYKIVSPR